MPSIALLDGPADHDGTQAVTVDTSWEKLSKGLHSATFTECVPCPGEHCPAKTGRAWLPVRMVESPCKRLDSNVAVITFAVFDLDAPTDAQMGALARNLAGQEYLCHQTHRGNGYRLILTLTEEIPAAMWRDVWPRIVERFQIPADPTCVNESRLYYAPSRPKGSDYKVFDGSGAPLDWKALDPVFPRGVESAIAAFKQSTEKTAREIHDPTNPANLRAGPVDLGELRKAVASMRRPESRSLLDTILNGQTLAVMGFRDTVLNQACSLLATAPLGKAYPADAIVALLHGSIRAMDCEPEGLDHWLDEARKKYLRAVGRRLERDAKSDEDRAAILRVLGQADVKSSDDEWRRNLLYLLNAAGEPGGLRPIGANANMIFKHDVNWKGTIRFNEITREIDVIGGPLAGKPKASLDCEAANWLARSEYKLFLSSQQVGEQMLAVAREHAYDPLRDWLESVSWDGTDRVSTFFENYFGATGDVLHLRAISRCFLVSCAARVMEPGCEVHTVPVLIGAQGAGKSRGIKALGMPYFCSATLNVGDKDSRMLAASTWIVELAELAAIRAGDIEKVKGFVSEAFDKLRPPYGRVHEIFLRRCVYVGTTNEDEILNDWTGERRWWPLHVGSVDVEALRADRDQLFAQALALYRAGTKWYLTPDEEVRAKDQASGFKRSSVRAEQILAWFACRQPAERPSDLTSFDLLNTVLGVPSAQINTAQMIEVGHAARELGFTKHRKRHAGQAVWVYRTPQSIREMKKDDRPVALEVVVQAKESK